MTSSMKPGTRSSSVGIGPGSAVPGSSSAAPGSAYIWSKWVSASARATASGA